MSRPLRILVAHNVRLTQPGGMSRLMGALHEAVARRGHRVEYFGAEDLPRRFAGRAARFAFPWAVWERAREAAKKGEAYDIINVHEPAGAPVACWRGPLGNPAVVAMSHGVERREWRILSRDPLLPRPSLRTRVIYPVTSLWQSRLALSRADHVLCVADEHKLYLESWLRLPPDRVTRLYPGVSPVFFEAAGRRDYGRFRTLVFAGTWIPRKGTAEIVAAFESLAALHRDLELVVLGGGKPAAEILAAFPLELRRRVSCRQTSSEAETASALAGCDAFVLPSLSEGTPLTLVEAMASGLPVVTTATCGMKDVIRQGENGILVGLHDAGALVKAVERLASDAGLRARLGEQARRDAQSRHRWAEVAMPLLDVYERLTRIEGDAVERRRGGGAG